MTVGSTLLGMNRSPAVRQLLGWAAVLAAALAAMAMARAGVTATDIVFYTTLWGAAATAWAIQGGLAGRLSLGHAAYFGTGAYATVIAGDDPPVSPWLLLIAAVLLCAAGGALVELVTAKLEGIYYALATFAFAQILWLMARGWTSLTGGTAGLTLPLPEGGFAESAQFVDPVDYTAVSTLLLVLTGAVYFYYGRSKRGYSARALRDSYRAGLAVGIEPLWTRAQVSAISAALTGVVGFLFATYVAFVDPDVAYSFHVSTLIILPAIIGGSTVFLGPALGAFLVIPLRQWLLSMGISQLHGLDWIIYGASFVLFVTFLPRGLAGSLPAGRKRVPWRLGGKSWIR